MLNTPQYCQEFRLFGGNLYFHLLISRVTSTEKDSYVSLMYIFYSKVNTNCAKLVNEIKVSALL